MSEVAKSVVNRQILCFGTPKIGRKGDLKSFYLDADRYVRSANLAKQYGEIKSIIFLLGKELKAF